MPSPTRPAGRAEPREVAELKRLKDERPELAGAADLHIALLELYRRVQSRVPIPCFDVASARGRLHQQTGPLLRFEEIPLSWTDVRLMLRETAELLHRYEHLSDDDFRTITALGRDSQHLERIVRAWYDAPHATAPGPAHGEAGGSASEGVPEGLDGVLQLAMRPFLARCAEAAAARLSLEALERPRCPVCAGEPEFAVITVRAERLLVCGRCTARWKAHPLACPFCGNDDRTRITSFASRDGQYRIYACDVCRRYLKAHDGRHAARPLMLALDSVATLPLDAATMQRGYTN